MDIKLKLLTFGKFSQSAIELANSDKLRVIVDTPLVVKWNYIAVLKNEATKFSIRIVDGTFEVPRELLTNGTLNTVVEARANGETLRSYQCEPLAINVVDDKITIVPEIAKMEQEVADLTKLCNQLGGKVDALENQCKTTLEIVMKLNGLTAKVVE